MHVLSFPRRSSGVPLGVEIASPERMRRIVRRYRNPVVPNMADRQAWNLYDRQKKVAGVSDATILFFQVPISGTKPKEDTNMIQAGRLEDPQRFFVTALRIVMASAMSPVDIDEFQKKYYCEFYIGQKIYQEGPLVLFPGGGGVQGMSTATSQAFWNNGAPDPRAINLLGEEGVWILQGQQFRVEVKTTTTFTMATAQNILVVLDGILYRQVQ